MGEITVKHGGNYFMGTMIEQREGMVCVIPSRSCGIVPGLRFGVAVWVEKSAVLWW